MTHEKNMKYLLSTQELYLEVCKKIKGNADSIKAYEGYFEALDLLYQQPKLGDFVATNEDGEVMEKPRDEDGEPGKKMQYQSALDRVIWKGWHIGKHGWVVNEFGDSIGLVKDSKFVIDSDKTTYEKLINSGVKLERIQRK